MVVYFFVLYIFNIVTIHILFFIYREKESIVLKKFDSNNFKFHNVNNISKYPKVLSLAKYAERWLIKSNYLDSSCFEYNSNCIYVTFEEEVVALIVHNKDFKSTRLDLIYIKKDFRGYGLLKKMMKKIKDKKLIWWFHEKNIQALYAYLNINASITKDRTMPGYISAVLKR